MLSNIIITILGVIEVLCGILLVAMILLQKSRSHGAAAGLAFGAGMGESLFGAQATNILQKITVVLTTIFLVNTTLMAFLGSRRHHGAGGRSVTDDLPSTPAPIAAPASSGPISQGPVEMSPSAPVSPAPAATVPSPGPAQQPVMLDVPAATPAPAAPAAEGAADPKPAQP